MHSRPLLAAIPLALALLTVAAPAARARPCREARPGADDAALAARTMEVLGAHCSECHGPRSENVKARKWIDDITRPQDWVETMVGTGAAGAGVELGSVRLWMTLSDPDPEMRMPPPEAKEGPLALEELALVRWWIEAGAPLPPAAPPSAGDALEADPGPGVAPPGAGPEGTGRALRWLGRWHVLVVHFPIGLLLAAALAELLAGRAEDRAGLRAAGRYCLWLGAASAAVAAALGWLHARHAANRDWVLALHQGLGWATAAVSLAAALSGERGARWFRALLFVTAGLVAAAGYFGGALVHGLGHLGW